MKKVESNRALAHISRIKSVGWELDEVLGAVDSDNPELAQVRARLRSAIRHIKRALGEYEFAIIRE